MGLFVLLFVLCNTGIVLPQRFIGYDCGSRALNITTLSILDVEECDIPARNVEETKIYIQLLQLNEYTQTQAIQCKVEIFREIFHCEEFSHLKSTNNAIAEFLQEVSAEDCKNMHPVGVWARTTDQLVQGLRVNRTVSVPVEYAGHSANGGSCKGAHYADTYGSWNNVVVKGIIRITLKQQSVRVSLEDNRVHLASGTIYPLNTGSYTDVEG